MGIAWSFSSGPPNSRTGAPGEGTCFDCHNTHPINSGSGSMTVTGPATYLPGDTVDLTVGLQHTGQRRWGFELTALDENNNPAGAFFITDPTRTWFSVDPVSKHQYAKNSSDGTDIGVLDTAPGWSLKWIAPARSAGTVTFYAAGNASNGDSTTGGNYIYTTTKQIAIAPEYCCVIAGDHNHDGSLDISDLTYYVGYMFDGGPAPVCIFEGDLNADGSLDISDLTYIIDYMFAGGPLPVAC